jgi:phosphate transport system protein
VFLRLRKKPAMSHYEERLERDLSRIKQQVALLAGLVEKALDDAVHALLADDDRLAYATVLADNRINAVSNELDRMRMAFIGVHLPTGSHLRLMGAVVHANVALERIGDYAVTICREAVQVPRPPQGLLQREIELMAGESRQMLKQAVDAFLEGNADKAKATMVIADQVERTFDMAFDDLIGAGGQSSVKDLFAFLSVFNALERVSDQAKNICEDTVFAVTGQGKGPKFFRILFVDEDNSLLGPIAEAIARKNFPEVGEYHSRGRTAGVTDPQSIALLQDLGIDLGNHRPQAIPAHHQEFAAFQIIVSLQGPVKSYVEQIPFHTVALEWEVTRPGSVPPDLRILSREIALQVSNLMTVLRGEEAN